MTRRSIGRPATVPVSQTSSGRFAPGRGAENNLTKEREAADFNKATAAKFLNTSTEQKAFLPSPAASARAHARCVGEQRGAQERGGGSSSLSSFLALPAILGPGVAGEGWSEERPKRSPNERPVRVWNRRADRELTGRVLYGRRLQCAPQWGPVPAFRWRRR